MKIYPKKSLGQNFLIEPSVLPKIICAAEIQKGEVVIEVGPGQGILTAALLEAGAEVYAIEKDFELAQNLEKIMRSPKNLPAGRHGLKVVHQDALFFDLSKFANYKVVSNLPFNIASPLIRKFLEADNSPKLMILMVQKEVAEKIVAKPGDSNRGILTLAVEFYADAEIIQNVPKTSFKPQPKVDAAVIRIKPHPDPKPHLRGGGELVELELFFKIVKAGFASKRRKISNSLAAALRLEKNVVLDLLKASQIKPELRAEDLSLEEWKRLTQEFRKIL